MLTSACLLMALIVGNATAETQPGPVDHDPTGVLWIKRLDLPGSPTTQGTDSREESTRDLDASLPRPQVRHQVRRRSGNSARLRWIPADWPEFASGWRGGAAAPTGWLRDSAPPRLGPALGYIRLQI